VKATGALAGRERKAPGPEPVILFVIAKQIFAIAADDVQEIRSTDSLAGGANEIGQAQVAKVRHTILRNRRTYYVVNGAVHFGLLATRPSLVLILRQRRVAVLVDRIERMAEIPVVHDLPRAFAGTERHWYRGLAYIDNRVIPVVDPAGFLTGEELGHLDRASAPPAVEQAESPVRQ